VNCGTRLRHGSTRLNHAVVAALDAGVMLVAWDQKKSVSALFDDPATGRRAIAGVQVDDRALLPQKRVPNGGEVARRRNAHDLRT
jgi:hypothetical protein